jgi:hypothetical protein
MERETTKHISVAEQSRNGDFHINWPTDGEWKMHIDRLLQAYAYSVQ